MGNKQPKERNGAASSSRSPSPDGGGRGGKKPRDQIVHGKDKPSSSVGKVEQELDKMTKIPQNEIKNKDKEGKGGQSNGETAGKGGVRRSNSFADSSSKSKSSGDLASRNIPAGKGKSAFGRKSQKDVVHDVGDHKDFDIEPPKQRGSIGPKKGNSKLSLMDSHGSKHFGRRESLAPPSKSNSKKQSESEVVEPEIMQEDVEEEIEEEVLMESQNYSSMAKTNMKKLPKIKTDLKQKKNARKMLKKNRTTMSYKGIYNQFAELDDEKQSAYNFDDMFGTVIHEKMGLVSKRTNKSSHVSLWSTHQKDPLQKLDEEADELLQSVDRSMKNFSLSRASSGAPSTLYGQSSMNGPTLKAMMNLISVNEFIPRSLTHYSNRGSLTDLTQNSQSDLLQMAETLTTMPVVTTSLEQH